MTYYDSVKLLRVMAKLTLFSEKAKELLADAESREFT